MKCPVCNKECNEKAGVSSHLFKTKDEEHIIFVETQKQMVIDAFYEEISCEKLAAQEDFWAGTTFICEIWKKIPGYKERKSKMDSNSMKKQYQHGDRKINPNFTKRNTKYKLDRNDTISSETYNKIISFFDSNLSFKKIAVQCNCDPKTVKPTFIREFGEEKYKERVDRIQHNSWERGGESNSLKTKDLERYNLIVKEFSSDRGLHIISKELNTGAGTIKKIWIENFGQEEFEKRVIKMFELQRERAAKSIKKAKFLGSKNEIYCYELLDNLYPFEVKHHDYSIVPKLEIDISFPFRNIAICWDGIGHRKPVFGSSQFERACRNDVTRSKILEEKGWKHISVIDNGAFDPKFVEQKVKEIVDLINKDFQGKVAI